jgi:transcriptional regulator with XRE-family HTH domain
MAMSYKEMVALMPRALLEGRTRANLSVEELAGKAGISSQAVNKHESGSNLPQGEVFLKELDVLGLDFGSFHELMLELRASQRVEKLAAALEKLSSRVSTLERGDKA